MHSKLVYQIRENKNYCMTQGQGIWLGGVYFKTTYEFLFCQLTKLYPRHNSMVDGVYSRPHNARWAGKPGCATELMRNPTEGDVGEMLTQVSTRLPPRTSPVSPRACRVVTIRETFGPRP